MLSCVVVGSGDKVFVCCGGVEGWRGGGPSS